MDEQRSSVAQVDFPVASAVAAAGAEHIYPSFLQRPHDWSDTGVNAFLGPSLRTGMRRVGSDLYAHDLLRPPFTHRTSRGRVAHSLAAAAEQHVAADVALLHRAGSNVAQLDEALEPS